jgi:hypothetical protein
MLYGGFWNTQRKKYVFMYVCVRVCIHIHTHTHTYIYNVQYLTVYELMLQKLTSADAYDRLVEINYRSNSHKKTLCKRQIKIWCN